MNKLSYFFRGVADNHYFALFSPTHFAMIFTALFGVLIIFRYQDKMRQQPLYNKIKWIFIILLLTQQTLLYLWYGLSGYFILAESLPLEHQLDVSAPLTAKQQS